MSQENATHGQAADEKAALPPANLPEELLPVYDWYRTQGRQLVLGAIVVLAVVLGVKAYLRYRDNQVAEASAALLSAESVEGLENLAAQYGKGKLGPLIQLQLAKAYYHAGNFAEAKAAYETLLKRHPGHDLADSARIGLAAAREGDGAFEEARQAFASFADAKPGHYLYPLAIMGQARCLAALEQKPAALDLLLPHADSASGAVIGGQNDLWHLLLLGKFCQVKTASATLGNADFSIEIFDFGVLDLQVEAGTGTDGVAMHTTRTDIQCLRLLRIEVTSSHVFERL